MKSRWASASVSAAITCTASFEASMPSLPRTRTVGRSPFSSFSAVPGSITMMASNFLSRSIP